jgi:hypothetical protein
MLMFKQPIVRTAARGVALVRRWMVAVGELGVREVLGRVAGWRFTSRADAPCANPYPLSIRRQLGVLLALGGALAGRTVLAAGQPAAGSGTVAASPQPGERVVWPTVTLLDGERWGPAQAAGRAMIVVFWSTTCPFCLRHNAHIEKLRRTAAPGALGILTVARDRDPTAVAAYMARLGYGFPVTLDHAVMASALSTRRVIPLSVVVDRDGRLRQVIAGEMFEEDVMAWSRLG